MHATRRHLHDAIDALAADLDGSGELAIMRIAHALNGVHRTELALDAIEEHA
jgi:hypothetical protein